MVIVDENHTQAQAQASMPYLVSLQNTFGVTSHHTATTHPSLPNYLEIAGGSTFGVTDDAAPGSHPIAGVSVFGSALARGESARTYNESMSTACQQTSSGNYAVKHNPWAYFLDERTECQANDLPLTSLPGDITAGTLPNVGMITPDLCDDGHDCSLGTADARRHGCRKSSVVPTTSRADSPSSSPSTRVSEQIKRSIPWWSTRHSTAWWSAPR
jgi:phosphatidylinositol-3-phosphatase